MPIYYAINLNIVLLYLDFSYLDLPIHWKFENNIIYPLIYMHICLPCLTHIMKRLMFKKGKGIKRVGVSTLRFES